jgi:formate/nitrite transporter FocA (FNT family)
MAYNKLDQIAKITVETGVKKARNPLMTVLILGFMGGAFIALGFLLYIRVIACAPKEWGSIDTFIGASLFPIGLILVLLAGGELLTGNMMALSLARFQKRSTTGDMFKNLVLITLSHFVGA